MLPTSEVVDLHAQNARVPIAQLTDELLRSLFIRSNGNHHQRNARSFSQVCSRWRLVSLSTPILWSFIDRTGSFKWVQECLRRSVDAPCIEFHYLNSKIFDQVLAVSPDIIPRIRSLYGSISIQAWEQLLDGIQKPGAQLKDLSLDGLGSHAITSNAPSQPLEHIHGQLPLRGLCWSNCDLNMCFPVLTNITNFVLVPATIPIYQLASLIEKMPLLERLTLSLSLDKPFFSYPNEPNLPVISIPCLRYLRIDIGGLLDHLIIPPECVLQIYGRLKDYTGSTLKAVTNRFIMNHTTHSNTHLSIELSDMALTFRNLCFALYEHHLAHMDYDQFTINTERVRLKQWLPIVLKFMADLVPILPSVISLSFKVTSYGIGGGLKHIIPFFRHFTGVKSLHFYNERPEKAFTPPDVVYDDGTGSKILFPSLETFHLPVNFEPNDVFQRGDQLQSYLSWRIQHGRPIKYVKGRYGYGIINFEQQYANFVHLLEGRYGIQVDILEYIK